MGMAGGAYKGDKDRAQRALQAAQLANSSRAQAASQQHQREVLAEQARQADMADARANRALDIQAERAQGAQEPQERRSPYSVFSNADILAQARQAAADRRLATLSGQNSTLGQFQQVVDMEKRQQQAKREQGQSTMASLMKMAMANGGVAPMAALNLANRRFGFDGKTRAIGAAGFTQNGDWFVDFLQKDQNGQLSRQTSTMPFEQQGQVFYGQAGIFDNADRAAWRKGMLDRKYSTQEVNSMSGLNATMLEGLDEAGLQRLEQGFVNPVSGTDWKQELAFRKQQLAEYKAGMVKKTLAESLGLTSDDPALEAAFKRINDKNFLEANRTVSATQADVDAGLAKNVGDRFIPTRDYLFKRELNFYRENLKNSDPAVNPTGVQPQPTDQPPPQDGGQPPPTDQPQPQLQNGGEAAPEEEPPTDPHGTTRGYGHVIEGDDDLVSVAIKYNVSPSELMDLNGIKNRDEIPDLPAGTRLILPDGAKGAKPLPSDSKESQQGELDFGEGGAPVGDGGETAPPPAPEGGEGGGGGEGGEGGGAPPPPPPQNGGEEKDESNGMAAGAKSPYAKWLRKRR